MPHLSVSGQKWSSLLALFIVMVVHDGVVDTKTMHDLRYPKPREVWYHSIPRSSGIFNINSTKPYKPLHNQFPFHVHVIFLYGGGILVSIV